VIVNIDSCTLTQSDTINYNTWLVWFIALRMNAGCAGKTMRSLENACHT